MTNAENESSHDYSIPAKERVSCCRCGRSSTAKENEDQKSKLTASLSSHAYSSLSYAWQRQKHGKMVLGATTLRHEDAV